MVLTSVQTAVGDRYVVEEMKKGGYNLRRRTIRSYYFLRLQHNRVMAY